ncbi:hypothetical protein GLOTRDRAFT_128976 [Gloeophyllum trabeum ATCC 11539]|uniref:Aminoglycoside phosphotransferase domain-containing protein n=1 Tax=Gloeophyllum trabeum (strain ATCC 11539 / FP-39264 / Madison 617) TaxID=670483 RepID=S7RRX3_GLOTA|nr:uncharacterized protein GLOTRDRAFT_128976 [Gloeophyllum trabeum ATCC 11539]EPQ55759.1 hypothetical protein GLOTRDRAFT_128976 [Gloeophyllum trabeum ATCC 11539]
MAANYDVECFAVSATTNDNVDNLLAWIVDTFAPITATRAEISSFRLQSFLHSLLDVIAACFALPNATRTPDVDEEVSKLTSYEDIRSLLRGDLAEKWDANLKHRLLADHAQYVTVHRITPSLILKEGSACGPSERATMEYVLQHTTIPVPRVHCPDQPHLIMDHIEGEMLSECWDQLSSFMQFRIACTLRLYVRQLQNLKSQHVGDVESGYAGGIFFDGSWYGPFDSVKRFRQFCEWIAFEGWRPFACAARLNQRPIPPLPNSCSDWAPVFTHGDLNPSNILLSKDGVLWVIDWGEAGFYPSCMETLVMRHHDTVVHAEDHPPSWKRYREFIAGIATKEEQEFWGHFHTAIHRFPGRDIQ